MPSPAAAPRLPSAAARPGAARVGLALGPALFLAILFWPGPALSADQRGAAAVTAWTAAWWITGAVPIGAASLLPAVLLPACGVMAGGDVAPLYMHDLVFLFLGAFTLALGLERWGVHLVTLVFQLWVRRVLGIELAVPDWAG
jgi:di/tricarboxylate transporter